TVYQEQVMLLSRLLGSFTRGESDTLRKAMGKKIKSKLDELRPEFLKRGTANGHDQKVLKKIWADWEKFASYAFNKSHATCYSWVAFQTAYLKANYPSEYMAAVLSRNLSDVSKLTVFMTECKRMGIQVLGSCVNESMKTFSANRQGDIRFGMAAIKGMGEAAAESIIRERETNGAFKDFYDFFERINYTEVNKKCLESLALAGALDSLTPFHRSKFLAPDPSGMTFLEAMMRYGQRVQSERMNAQQSLFGGGEAADIQRPVVPQVLEWSQLETLNREREVMGLYLSAHPLDEYRLIMRHMCKTELSELNDLDALKGQEVCVAGLVVAAQQDLMTRTGKNFGKFTMEDYNSSFEFALFGKDYEQFRQYMFQNYFLMVRCKIQPRPYQKEGEPERLELKVLSIMQLQEVRDTLIHELLIKMKVNELTPRLMQDMVGKIQANTGNVLVRFLFTDDQGVVLRGYSKPNRVEMSSELVDWLDENEIEYSIS
ncbi:MAG: DNA polymerase III subunit alpha, partial [Alistipes sp.]|nr:DNA polymerase III subunit alpha [Alistipes sp.]